MASAAGLVVAAGAIEFVNDALFAPIAENKPPWQTVNWRIVPATAIMALMLTGVEKLSPKFGVGLGGLVLLSVFIVPYGNAPTPIQNVSKLMNYTSKAKL
jgi:hypothetical protein